MRVWAFVGAVVLSGALAGAAAALVGLQTPEPRGPMWLVTTAISAYLLPPMIVGGLASYWDPELSAEARRAVRRVLAISTGLQVIATVLMCVYSVLTGAPWWLTVLFTGVAVVLMAVAVVAGPALRRSDRNPPARIDRSDYSREDLRRDVRRILLAAVVTLVIAAVLIGVSLAIFIDDSSPNLFVYAPLFALMAGAFACMLVTMRLGRELRSTVDGDLGRARDIGNVVIRGKTIPLSEDDQAAAARFAATSWVAQTYQSVGFACLYAALIAMQVLSLLSDPANVFPLWIVILLGVTFVAFGPAMVVQARRTWRYAADHRGARAA